MIDGSHALVEAEGGEDAAGSAGETDGAAHESDAEEGFGGSEGGHFGVGEVLYSYCMALKKRESGDGTRGASITV